MRIAILLLVIGVTNGIPPINWDAFDRDMEEMGTRLEHMGEHVTEDSSWPMENWRKHRNEDREKRREERRKFYEEREKEREERRRQREEREREREERRRQREERQKERAARRRQNGDWNKFHTEVENEFQNNLGDGSYIQINHSSGNEGIVVDTGNARTHTIAKNLPNGEYYYLQTKDEIISGVVHRTVTKYNQQTKQYEITKYEKNANDPNAEFVKV